MALHRLKSATWLAALAGAIAAPGPAAAQFYFDTWGGAFEVPLDRPYRSYGPAYRDYDDAAPLDRREIRSILTRRGYRVEPSMARNNDVYVVDAIDPAGRRLRLIVDAYDASILRRFESGAPRRVTRQDDRERWLEDDGPTPPRVIPGMGPTQKPRPAPRKPATARVEPKPSPKGDSVQPSPAPVAPPPTAPAPTGPGPAASEPAKPVEQQAAAPARPAEPAAKTGAAPRVIPLYRKPDENGSAQPEKPAEGPP